MPDLSRMKDKFQCSEFGFVPDITPGGLWILKSQGWWQGHGISRSKLLLLMLLHFTPFEQRYEIGEGWGPRWGPCRTLSKSVSQYLVMLSDMCCLRSAASITVTVPVFPHLYQGYKFTLCYSVYVDTLTWHRLKRLFQSIHFASANVNFATFAVSLWSFIQVMGSSVWRQV